MTDKDKNLHFSDNSHDATDPKWKTKNVFLGGYLKTSLVSPVEREFNLESIFCLWPESYYTPA